MKSDGHSPRVAFSTLGCKVNQSETELLSRQFTDAGYTRVPFDAAADVYVVNTCTVTHVADKKSRQLLGQARRSNPEALIVASGCYASIVGEALAGERILVIRNRDKDHILDLVEGRLRRTPKEIPFLSDPEKYLSAAGSQDRTRAMVKAQDGCDSHCTYCIIPRARGRSRSVAPNDIVQRVTSLVREGHAEIVITGVDLGSYGEDHESLPDLGGLLNYVLSETDVPRLRVSSLEPGDFKESWLELWKSPRMCKHLHVPLQAGSSDVLRRMERKYLPHEFSAMVAACRQAVPNMTLTTDVMVGFPGETNEEFEEGCQFIRGIRFDGMHVFKYSKRSGTRAARMPNQVPEDVKLERSRLLRQEAAEGANRLIARHLNTSANVVWESAVESVWRGLTDTAVRIYGQPATPRTSSLQQVHLTAPFRDGVWGEATLNVIPLRLVRSG